MSRLEREADKMRNIYKGRLKEIERNKKKEKRERWKEKREIERKNKRQI